MKEEKSPAEGYTLTQEHFRKIQKTWPMTSRAIDSVVGVFSPKRANIRRHFRLMDSDSEYKKVIFAMIRAGSQRGYRNSKNSNNVPWLGRSETADQAKLTTLESVRNQARKVNMDDPIASGLTRTFVENVIGTGMRPQARTEDPEKNKLIEKSFRLLQDNLFPAERLSFGLGQSLIFRKLIEDGEVFVKRSKLRRQDPLFFEIIEADRVVNPAGKTEFRGRKITAGVEKNSKGIPVAYWVRKVSPGQTFVFLPTEDNFVRVPAEDIKHLKLVQRPGQTRGEPIFHAILQDLADLDLLILASLKRMQIAACLSIFIKSDNDANELLNATKTAYAKGSDEFGWMADEPIQPGMMFKLYPNEDIETLIPNFPSPELGPFIIQIARRIGASLGVAWQVVLKDFAESTFSSARTDLLESRQTYKVFQQLFIAEFANWMWESVLEDAKLRNDPNLRTVSFDELKLVQFIVNGWPWVDPKKDAEAAKIELEMGTTNLRILCAMKGLDWEEVIRQRIIEKALIRKLSIEAELPVEPDPSEIIASDDDDDDDEEAEENRVRKALKNKNKPVKGAA